MGELEYVAARLEANDVGGLACGGQAGGQGVVPHHPVGSPVNGLGPIAREGPQVEVVNAGARVEQDQVAAGARHYPVITCQGADHVGAGAAHQAVGPGGARQVEAEQGLVGHG